MPSHRKKNGREADRCRGERGRERERDKKGGEG